MSKFFDAILNNEWSYVRPKLNEIVAKKIANRVIQYKDQLKKSGSFQESKG